MKIVKKFMNFLENRFFLRNYILVLIPSIIFILFMFMSVSFFTKTYKDILIESYRTNLVSICSQTENSINNLINNVNMLYLDSDFMNVVTKNENNVDQEDIYKAATVLNYLNQTSRIIDSAFILNRTQHIVYGTIGKYNIDEFFNNTYTYKDYPIEYWQKYQSPMTQHQILSPSNVEKFSSDENVIPIVFTKINDTPLNSIIVINIKISQFFDILEKNKLTPHSFFNIINKHQSKAYDKTSLFPYELDKTFFNNCINNVNSCFNYRLNGDNHVVISYSPYDSVLGYSYVIFMPYKDIHAKIIGFLLALFLALILVIIAVLYFAKFSVTEVYKPINKLINRLSNSDSDIIESKKNDDPVMRLDNLFNEIQDKNNELESQLLSSLSLVQERNLIALLNQNEYYIEDAANYLLQDDPFDFEYDYFCSVIFNISLTDKFYSEYNTMEYTRIFNGFITVVKCIFSEHFKTYVIPSETSDTFYLLLNLPDTDQNNTIANCISTIKNLLKEDALYASIYIAVGGVYKDIKGLRKSHYNATKEITNKTNLERNRLNLSLYKTGEQKQILLSDEDELKINDYCLVGQTAQAFKLIKNIVLNNIKRHISSENLEKLYKRIISMILNIIRNNDIEYEIEFGSDSELIDNVVKKETQEIFSFIEKLLEIISNNVQKDMKVDINIIKKYVDLHYQESNSGIEYVADIFGISPKYLSRKFKEETGITFTSYLTECRINQSKNMLVQTNLSINEIGQQVGYPIVSTFIRAFKKINGISPSEYRKQFKKKS